VRSIVTILLGLLAVPGVVSAGSGDAADKVERGIKHYSAGDYKAAAAAFAEADVAQPDDPRIIFDRACVYAAAGDVERAVELFQTAALSPDPALAARCHYNRGRLAAGKAQAVFGERPEDASAEIRQEGLQLLIQAVGHFRDCIEMEPDHADARHNLEVIRLWIKHMQSLWQERDRQKQRDEMNLLEFLLSVEARQRQLRATGKLLVAQLDSPKRRQALSAAGTSQRSLAEEIGPLKEKIAQMLAAPQQAPGQPAAGPSAGTPLPPSSSQPDSQDAAGLLNTLADEVAQAMLSAAGELDGRRPADAVKSQTDAVAKLDEIYKIVVPYPRLLRRALDTQQELVDRAAPAEETPEETPDAQSPQEHPREDIEGLAWTQGFVAGWSGSLVPKAEQGLEGLKSGAPSAGKDPRQTSSDAKSGEKQIEGLRQSMQKAVELGPKVQALTAEAASDLQNRKPADALPKQQQALKLLKEIAEPLPKQQQKNQQNQDEKKKEREKNKPQKKDQQQEKQQRKPRDLSKEQAKALFRKVRRRQDERQKLRKQAQQYFSSPAKVERDW